jgi:hypothetical protein
MPKLIHQEKMCCGMKRCPVVHMFDDGSLELSDDDAELGSVGVIKIRPEVADRPLELLSERKK